MPTLVSNTARNAKKARGAAAPAENVAAPVANAAASAARRKRKVRSAAAIAAALKASVEKRAAYYRRRRGMTRSIEFSDGLRAVDGSSPFDVALVGVSDNCKPYKLGFFKMWLSDGARCFALLPRHGVDNVQRWVWEPVNPRSEESSPTGDGLGVIDYLFVEPLLRADGSKGAFQGMPGIKATLVAVELIRFVFPSH